MPLQIVAVLVLVLALAPTARAQHPLPQGSRPLHVRLAAADVVAVGTVGAISDGRVEIRDATVLRGDAAASFEIKRSPAKALPFATGVPAVLLLRGARSPYVLVDEPREIVLLRDSADVKRWSEALRALRPPVEPEGRRHRREVGAAVLVDRADHDHGRAEVKNGGFLPLMHANS